MRKSLIAAPILACCAGSALAQSTEPQFWFWSTPTEAGWNDPQFTPMVLVYGLTSGASTTGALAAAETRDKLETYINNGWVNIDRVLLCLYNFGNWRGDFPYHASSLFHSGDMIDPVMRSASSGIRAVADLTHPALQKALHQPHLRVH